MIWAQRAGDRQGRERPGRRDLNGLVASPFSHVMYTSGMTTPSSEASLMVRKFCAAPLRKIAEAEHEHWSCVMVRNLPSLMDELSLGRDPTKTDAVK